MKTETFANMLSDIDEAYVKAAEERAPRAKAHININAGSILRIAAAAIFVVAILATTVAGAAGMLTPIIERSGSSVTLHYGNHPSADDNDLPVVSLVPGETPRVTGVKGNRITFDSEDAFKAAVGNKIGLPGAELGLEFVSANGYLDNGDVFLISDYLLDGKEIRIRSHYDHTNSFDSDGIVYQVGVENVISEDSKDICGTECILIHSAGARNYVSAVLEHEAYLIRGKGADMATLEAITASIIGNRK